MYPASPAGSTTKAEKARPCPPHPCAVGSCLPFPSSESQRLSERLAVCSLAQVEWGPRGWGAAVAGWAELLCLEPTLRPVPGHMRALAVSDLDLRRMAGGPVAASTAVPLRPSEYSAPRSGQGPGSSALETGPVWP